MLANLTSKLRTSVRDKLLYDSCVWGDVADEEVTRLCTGDCFARWNNIHGLVPLINPDGDGVKSFAQREVGDKVCAHDLKGL
jgi:hypothetical protein